MGGIDIGAIMDLEQLKAVNPDKVSRDELVDIQDIVVDTTLPKEERIADFIRKIENPYLCKCGNIVVQSVFEHSDITLTELLAQYLKLV